ncbi:retrotransposon protein, putative, ty1-copia subclass [Tanacetum coccineum]|uniref:Retrotransposon protein, putative, ty1-copia subclass n=1 Tax=Tanacetum coccineum TaxID=301880 RepID=A0ABQ5J719_9ASTR
MSIRVLLAKERILKLIQVWDEKQIKPWSLPELLLQLSNDSRTIAEILKQREEKRIEREQAANLAVQKEQEEQAAQSFTPYWNFPMIDDDDDEHTIQYRLYLERSSKAITPDLPTEEPHNSLSMGDEHLSTIPKTELDEVIKSSVEDLVPIPSESKGISDDICDMPFCDNDHFDSEFGLIDSLLSRDISITSPKIDFLPEEFAGELDLIDPILPGIDEDDFDEEEGAIDIDILQIEDEILLEKLLNVNFLIDKIEALNLTPFIPFVLEYSSSSPIPVMDSDFLIEEVDIFLVSEDSIPPGIESDFDSEGDIIFLDDLLNDDPIPEYERFTFDIEPDTAVINNFDELNEDECFDPGGGEIVFSQNVEDDDSFTFVIQTFLPFLTYPEDSSLPLSFGSEDIIFDPDISAFHFSSLKLVAFKCTDNAKITRKWSKLDKHGHGNGKSAQEPEILTKRQTLVNHWWHVIQRMELMLGSKANIEGLGLEILDAPQVLGGSSQSYKRDLYTVKGESRSTDVMVWNPVFDAHNEVACLMLGIMTSKLHRQFENYSPYDMLQELKSMFEKQAGGYVEQLDHLGYVLPQDLSVGLILNGLTSDFAGFVRNYNMHNMGKTVGELHALLIEYEKGLPKKAATPQVMAIQGGRIQKANKKSLNAKGKEHPKKDDACHHYKEVGHCKRNCLAYLAELIKKKKQVGTVILQLTPPYTPQHNGVSERSNHTLLDMVRLMMNLTTLPLSFWDYALESAIHIFNMVPTKKVDKTPYELWYGKVPNLSYLKVWRCEALVKRDTPNKLQQRYIKCIFIGYPKEMMGYYFYFPPENKIVVARYAEFFEKNIISQEVSGRAVELEEIQDEDASRSENTSKIPMEVEGFEPPQEEVIPVRRSAMTHRAPNHLCRNVEVDEHSLGDLNEPTNYKAAMLDIESDKWLDTVGSKWLFKKKTDMDGIVHTYKAHLVAKVFTQTYRVDYEETFSPIADIRVIRILKAITTFYDYEIWQMDVKTTFLNGYLDEDIYMVQPKGFIDPKHPRKVCKL